MSHPEKAAPEIFISALIIEMGDIYSFGRLRCVVKEGLPLQIHSTDGVSPAAVQRVGIRKLSRLWGQWDFKKVI